MPSLELVMLQSQRPNCICGGYAVVVLCLLVATHWTPQGMSPHFPLLDGSLLCSAGSSPEPLSSGSAQRSVWSQEGRASVALATLSLRSPGALRSKQMASSEVDGAPNKVSDLKKWTKRNFPGGPVAKTQSYQCRGHRFHPWPGN